MPHQLHHNLEQRIAQLPNSPITFDPEDGEEPSGWTGAEVAQACAALEARDQLLWELLTELRAAAPVGDPAFANIGGRLVRTRCVTALEPAEDSAGCTVHLNGTSVWVPGTVHAVAEQLRTARAAEASSP